VSIQPVGHGDFEVLLAGNRRLSLSRRYRADLERILGKLS